MADYELVVIGSGPAGQKAAIQAAKLGRRVALIEREAALGGVSANTGTIPSKTARAAILDLTGYAQRSVYGDAYRVTNTVTIDDLLWRTQHVIEHEHAVVRDQLRRNGVETIEGTASFLDPHTLEVAGPHPLSLVGDKIVIAVGTRPARPSGVDFDDRTVIDSDGLANLRRLPATMTVVGAGVIGIEYASMAATLGVTVTLVDKRTELLDFVDDELVDTAQPHIFAAGDVIGFPALAATSMEQGRLAACAAFGVAASDMTGSLPYGIDTIPEISFVGATQRQLTERRVPYVVGI